MSRRRGPGLGKIRMSVAAFDNLSRSARREAQQLRRALDEVKFSSPVPNTRRTIPNAPTKARGSSSRKKRKTKRKRVKRRKRTKRRKRVKRRSRRRRR